MVDGPPPSGGPISAAAADVSSSADKNALEMARQYSETKERVSEALDRKATGKPGEDKDDLKKELDMWEHKVTVEELEKKIGTSVANGLTTAEHVLRLERDGPNLLSPPKVTPWWVKLGAQFLNFFAILLEIASILGFVGYALDPSNKDNLYLGIVLIGVVIITALFTFFQEFKSEKTMEKFKNFLPPQSLVRRDGRSFQTDAAELVVGDVIEIQLGDKLPADIRCVEVSKLKVDNSSLTGESEPQSRGVDCTDDNPLETKNLAFFGTLAVDGTAVGVVVNTGDRTLFGRIAGLAAGSSSEVTTLQREIHHFVLLISTIAITLGVVFFCIGLGKGTPIIQNVVFSIGIIVANVPEGLLATVTVSLTLTAKRMAARNVLVKKLEAVETLGSTTTICSDKTGTLTQNRMTIVHLMYDFAIQTTKTATTEATFDMENPVMKALFFGAANCAKALFDAADLEANPDAPIDERVVNGDASEAGILKFCSKIEDVMAIREANQQVGGIPFNSSNKFMVTIHNDGSGSKRLLMKGAPERVLERCSKVMTSSGVKNIGPEDMERINEHLQTLMNQGERVLGFAHTALPNPPYDENFEFNPDEPNFPLEDLTFVGLMALLDPPRESVPFAVETCQSAGIQVIMVTGDHPATAKSIAKSVKIIRDPTIEDIAKSRGIPVEQVDRSEVKAIVVPGSQIKDLEEEDWNRVLAHDQIVFARTSPQQKLIIVENCQRLDRIVAVTGDGVNDSPALKKANIGVAMGIAGSDVSKEAADMILLDDNFSSIVSGVEEGRLIFDNLKKSIAYTLSSNIPEISPFLVFIISSIPLPLSTILILLIDLGTDMLPAISLAYEKAESDIMARKPRDAKLDHLVNRRLISFSYFQIGVIQALAGFFVYLVVLNDFGLSPPILPGLDRDGFFAALSSTRERWLFTQHYGVGKSAYGSAFADNKEGSASALKDFFMNVQQNPEFTEFGGDSENFSNLVGFAGRAFGQPPCKAYSCGDGVPATFEGCFSDQRNVTLSIEEDDSAGNNPDVIEVEDRGNPAIGEGCFQVWSHDQQQQTLRSAQGAFFVSIIIVQWADLLICKTRMLSLFQQGMKNWVLNLGLVEETLLAALLSYVPPISRAFGTFPLRFVHWLPGLPFSLFIFTYDELRKLMMRKGLKNGNRFGLWVHRFSYW